MNRYFNSFLKGMARIVNPFEGTSVEYLRIKRISDAEALRRDWKAVGGDMRRAIHQYEKERKE